MSTYETASDRFVGVGETLFAYRVLGLQLGTPLVLLMGFRGTMDHWDPALVNPLAARRPVVLIDNSGVGRSQGEIPETLTGWAKHYVDVIQALGFRRVDVMGYSMGGCVAQLMALNAPSLVRCLILCGTTPSYGKGVVSAPAGPFNRLKAARTPEEHRAAFLEAFFAQSERSQAAGAAAWDRISKARADRADYVPPDGSRRQAIAFAKFMHPKQPSLGSFNRLDELRMPVLVANGSHDVLLPTENSVLIWQRLSHANAQLHLFPDSGHGFLYQYASQFAELVNSFLDAALGESSRL